MKKNYAKVSVREVVAQVIETVLAALADGVAIWRKPWRSYGNGGRQLRANGEAYRGFNQALLGFLAASKGYTSGVWATFRQIKNWGGCVRKGERGTKVIYFEWVFKYKKDEVTGEDEVAAVFPRFFAHTVFNVDQADSVELPKIFDGKTAPDEYTPKGHTPNEKAEDLIKNLTETGKIPAIIEGGDQAYYLPGADLIRVPARGQFEKIEDFYHAVFHEIGHSTGAADRLNRKGISKPHKFGTPSYATEELIAESIAANLAALCGIFTEPSVISTVAYLANWAPVIKKNPEKLLGAMSKAERAVEWLVGSEVETPAEQAAEAAQA